MVALGWCPIDDLLGVVSNCCVPWDGVHDIVHLMISFKWCPSDVFLRMVSKL